MENPTSQTVPASPTLFALVAEVPSRDQLIAAARALRQAGFTQVDAFTPYPIHELDEALGISPTRLPWLVFWGGAAGMATALLLQWWTNAIDYPFRISGKPYFSLPANIPVAFELTVLFAAFAAFLGMIAINRLYLLHHPLESLPAFRRCSNDGLFLVVPKSDPQYSEPEIRRILQEHGGMEITECFDAPAQPLPRGVWIGLAVVTVLLLMPPALIFKARASRSIEPPMRLDFGMARQPSYKPQGFGAFFDDKRVQRRPVKGTIAWEEPATEAPFLSGKLDGNWVTEFPVELNIVLMKRGQNRYEVFCATCHGSAGYGDGLTAKRADALQEGTWVPPTSLHMENVRKQPVGELFNTITNGIRKMPAYGTRISPEDRWAIVLYVRALQRSQNATLKDVPADIIPTLKGN